MRLGMFVESDIGLRALYCPQIIRIKGLGRHGLGLSIQVYAWFSNDVRICAQHECLSWSQMKELDFWWLQGLPSIRPPFHLWLVLSNAVNMGKTRSLPVPIQLWIVMFPCFYDFIKSRLSGVHHIWHKIDNFTQDSLSSLNTYFCLFWGS